MDDPGAIQPRSAEDILKLNDAQQSAWAAMRNVRAVGPDDPPDPLGRIAVALERIAAALEGWPSVPPARNEVPPDDPRLSEGIRSLDLSLRARKPLCLPKHPRLDPPITTVGELIRYSADELTGRYQFGVTCLNEVREKLAAKGLTLKGD
jgi:DNA-directed RNA polymerase alpha subunit